MDSATAYFHAADRTVIATEHAAYDQVRVEPGDFAVASCPVT
jgi:hypothetical protein